MPWPAVAAGIVAVGIGVAGLVRGAVPIATSAPATAAPSQPIVVSGAYVHPPVPPNDTAAAYFTVDNETSTPDRLLSVQTGAGAVAVLHATTSDGSMVMATNGVTIPAHGTLTLRTGAGHVMIEQLYGSLKVGQTVNLDLQFADAGDITVAAPVVPLGTNSPPSPGPTSGGQHS